LQVTGFFENVFELSATGDGGKSSDEAGYRGAADQAGPKRNRRNAGPSRC
jgi:hypothetical protein